MQREEQPKTLDEKYNKGSRKKKPTNAIEFLKPSKTGDSLKNTM